MQYTAGVTWTVWLNEEGGETSDKTQAQAAGYAQGVDA